jgi:hypothetical protein
MSRIPPKPGELRYWHCIIGPVYQDDELPFGADAPMRSAALQAFFRLTGRETITCWSGWGMTEEEKEYCLSFAPLPKDEPAFGTNIRSAIKTLKDWWTWRKFKHGQRKRAANKNQ